MKSELLSVDELGGIRQSDQLSVATYYLQGEALLLVAESPGYNSGKAYFYFADEVFDCSSSPRDQIAVPMKNMALRFKVAGPMRELDPAQLLHASFDDLRTGTDVAELENSLPLLNRSALLLIDGEPHLLAASRFGSASRYSQAPVLWYRMVLNLKTLGANRLPESAKLVIFGETSVFACFDGDVDAAQHLSTFNPLEPMPKRSA